VEAASSLQRSPTKILLLGLVITLAAVLAYAFYITVQLSGLRRLQSDLVERNRKDSLQLLRVQNDLNLIGLAMRDMLDAGEPYPLIAWAAQFERIHEDLGAGLELEQQFAGASRTPEQQQYLSSSVAQFWDAVNRMFLVASEGRDEEAREQIRLSLQARQEALSTAVSRLLVQNNEGEQAAAARIAEIYDGVQRQLYVFLVATLVAIVLTSLYLIQTNRRLFARLEELSAQRSELAQKLIAAQESTLRHISRELHDEFGQVLTAIGAMLSRAGKSAPEGSRLREDLQEVREVAQSTLDNIRSLSQALHPVLLEEQGLESTLDWYIPTVERQTGITIYYEKGHSEKDHNQHNHYEKSSDADRRDENAEKAETPGSEEVAGKHFAIETAAGVHIYRIVQEALNNIVRHAEAKEAWVRLNFLENALRVEVEDHGKGFVRNPVQRGIGLVAMRERADLIGGKLVIVPVAGGGTLVRIDIPRERVEAQVG